jgi:hypothetical protein
VDSNRRRAQNEVLFRGVNDKIKDLNASFEQMTGGPSGFICECDDLHCSIQVAVPVEVFARTRSDRTQFIVAPGHEGERELERVVERAATFVIVEKSRADLPAGFDSRP